MHYSNFADAPNQKVQPAISSFSAEFDSDAACRAAATDYATLLNGSNVARKEAVRWQCYYKSK
jgi:hypothetical protein